jgi:hypothetical protein
MELQLEHQTGTLDCGVVLEQKLALHPFRSEVLSIDLVPFSCRRCCILLRLLSKAERTF